MKAEIAILVGVSVSVVIISILSVFFCWRRSRKVKLALTQDIESLRYHVSTTPHWNGSEASRIVVTDPTSSKGKEPLTSEQILGIDKRSLLETLPVHGSRGSSDFHVAPVGIHDNRDLRTYQPTSPQLNRYVNPWQVEYQPNPVHFSHLASSSLASTTNTALYSSSQDPTVPFSNPVFEKSARPISPNVMLPQSTHNVWDSESSQVEEKSNINGMILQLHQGTPYPDPPWGSNASTKPQQRKDHCQIADGILQISPKGSSVTCSQVLCTNHLSVSSGRNSERPEQGVQEAICEMDASESEVAKWSLYTTRDQKGTPHRREGMLGMNMFIEASMGGPSTLPNLPHDSSHSGPSCCKSEFESIRTCSRAKSTSSSSCGSPSRSSLSASLHSRSVDSMQSTDTSSSSQVSDRGVVEPMDFEDTLNWNMVGNGPAIAIARSATHQNTSRMKLSNTTPSFHSTDLSPIERKEENVFDSGSSIAPLSPRSSELSFQTSVTASSRSMTSTGQLSFACPDCNRTFRTAGLRRNHHNRKHNLRYTCVVCTVAFGLRADLERHEHTVHSDHFRSERRFWCTVPGCAVPKKEFTRKDNFVRHVERCRMKAAKGRGKEWTTKGSNCTMSGM